MTCWLWMWTAWCSGHCTRHLALGLKRLHDFYLAMAAEHRRMRDFYEMDDLYPERLKLKELGADVEQWQKEVLANEPKTLGKR